VITLGGKRQGAGSARGWSPGPGFRLNRERTGGPDRSSHGRTGGREAKLVPLQKVEAAYLGFATGGCRHSVLMPEGARAAGDCFKLGKSSGERGVVRYSVNRPG